MGWGEWAARIGGYALAPFTGGASVPIGEGIAQGLHSNAAVKDATATQQAATQQAVGQQQSALRTAGDVYGQQRQDTQNLAGIPYQTLGGLMGMNIPAIGPAAGNVPSTASPMGFQRGLVPASEAPPLGVQQGNFLLPAGAPQGMPTTLAQLAALAPATAKAKSTSGYKRA